ncbi:hypothetical protein TNCV_2897181 [Trichonephila clavipes]|nr:hypothetical protein TNCV_2897181 [Trichonephila clavipes]
MDFQEGYSQFEKHVLTKLKDQIETDPTPPNAEDLNTCTRILDVFEYQLIKKTRLTSNQHILYTMDSGITRKNQENYSLIEKENRKLMEEIQDLEGDLTLIGTCPIENFQYHSKLNSSKLAQKVNDSSKQLEIEFQKATANASVGNPSPNPPKRRIALTALLCQPKS